MKALFRLYDIPQFMEVPEPPPDIYRIAVPNPLLAVSASLSDGENPINFITFRLTAIYYENGVGKIPIYEAIRI